MNHTTDRHGIGLLHLNQSACKLETEKPIEDTCFRLESGYLDVLFSGRYQLEALTQLGEQIILLCQTANCNSALVDLTAAVGSLSMMDRYELVTEMGEHWPKPLRTAVIVRPRQTLKLLGFFWARMAKTRGFDVALFFDKHEALNWLMNFPRADY